MPRRRPFLRLTVGATLVLASTQLAAGCGDPDIVVSTTADELNSDGDCSLREAIQAANTDSAVDDCVAGTGDDVVRMPAGTYRITRAGFSEQQNLTGDLDIRSTVWIRGAGQGATIIDGNGLDRQLDVFGGASARVEDLTLQNGVAPPGRRGGALVVLDGGEATLRRVTVVGNEVSDGPNRWPDGGGIYNNGTTTVEDSLVTDNLAGGTEGSGGGIWNSGTLTVTRTTISDNTANGTNSAATDIDGGGGIYNAGGATITDSTIRDNTSRYRGGGIASSGGLIIGGSTISGNLGLLGGGIYTTNTTVARDSTLSGNDAKVSGGGLWSSAGITLLRNVTIALNRADSDSSGSGDGGGLFVSSGTTRIRNTVGHQNTDFGGEAPLCAGTVVSDGYNKIGGLTGCTLTGETATNILGGSALIGPLADNGGPTLTHLPQANSPVLDAADPAAPGSGGQSCAAADQRGVDRPRDGDGNGNARCDMGAVER